MTVWKNVCQNMKSAIRLACSAMACCAIKSGSWRRFVASSCCSLAVYVILRAAVRKAPLFDWFPLDFAGRALPTDAREGCNGFWGALLSMEDCWQQDHYGCNQGGSNKSG